MNNWLLLNLIGGALVLGTYFIFLRGLSQKTLWVGIDNPKVRTLYGVSMIFAAIGYLLFFWENQKQKKVSAQKKAWLIVFFLSAATWAPSLSDKKTVLWPTTLFALTGTSLAVAMLFWLETSPLARLGLGYLFFHVFVLDNLIWGRNFFLRQKTKT